jgi:hypothetical protein
MWLKHLLSELGQLLWHYGSGRVGIFVGKVCRRMMHFHRSQTGVSDVREIQNFFQDAFLANHTSNLTLASVLLNYIKWSLEGWERRSCLAIILYWTAVAHAGVH